MKSEITSWERIFAEEMDLSLSESDEELDQWLDEFAVHESFQSFYDETVDGSNEAKFVPGKNRSYSILNAASENPLNCEGKSFVTALAGSHRYGKEFELVVDFQVDDRLGTPDNIMSHHVVPRDAEGNIYGTRREGLNGADVIQEDEFAALYFLSEAMDAEAREELGEAERLRREASDLKGNSTYIGRRLQESQQNYGMQRGRV